MNIVVTGASKGIGYELVKIFSRDVRNRILAISRNVDNLKQLSKITLDETAGSNVQILAFDLTSESYEPLHKMIESYDSIDILINNAAILINKPFAELVDEDWHSIYSANVFAPARLIKELLPKMGIKSNSHVVNISSMGGYHGSAKFAGLSAYSSSKSALANLTECLSEEYKDTKIIFNCLALGAVETEMLRKAFPDYQPPLKSNDMAEFIADFALKGSRFISGKIIPVSLSTP